MYTCTCMHNHVHACTTMYTCTCMTVTHLGLPVEGALMLNFGPSLYSYSSYSTGNLLSSNRKGNLWEVNIHIFCHVDVDRIVPVYIPTVNNYFYC